MWEDFSLSYSHLSIVLCLCWSPLRGSLLNRGQKCQEASWTRNPIWFWLGRIFFSCYVIPITLSFLGTTKCLCQEKYATNCIQRSHYNDNVRTILPKNQHWNWTENQIPKWIKGSRGGRSAQCLWYEMAPYISVASRAGKDTLPYFFLPFLFLFISKILIEHLLCYMSGTILGSKGWKKIKK